MKNLTPGEEVDALLSSLQEGVEKAGRALGAMLTGVVAGNELILADLEAALAEMEAAVTFD